MTIIKENNHFLCVSVIEISLKIVAIIIKKKGMSFFTSNTVIILLLSNRVNLRKRENFLNKVNEFLCF